MNSFNFARIVSAQIAARPEAVVIITLDLLSAVSGCTLRRCTLGLAKLQGLMMAASVNDFGALKDTILRVGVSEAGKVESLAGPKDGDWIECTS